MLQLGSGEAAASTMLRCSAPFFFWRPRLRVRAKFAFYPLIPGLQLLAHGGWMRPSHQSQHSRQRPAPSGAPWTAQHVPGALGP